MINRSFTLHHIKQRGIIKILGMERKGAFIYR